MTTVPEASKRAYALATQIIAFAAHDINKLTKESLKSDARTAEALVNLESKILVALDEFQRSLWPMCETCMGTGIVDQALGGTGSCAAEAPCPDCSGGIVVLP